MYVAVKVDGVAGVGTLRHSTRGGEGEDSKGVGNGRRCARARAVGGDEAEEGNAGAVAAHGLKAGCSWPSCRS